MFTMVDEDRRRETVLLTAYRTTAAQLAHVRAAGIPGQFTMRSFRVGGSVSSSLEDTAVDEIMKIGGWKTSSTYYIGATTSAVAETYKRKTKARRGLSARARPERCDSHGLATVPGLSGRFCRVQVTAGQGTVSLGEMMCDPALWSTTHKDTSMGIIGPPTGAGGLM